MKSAKRFITACLTVTMIFQGLAPSTEVLAQELDAAGDTAVQAAYALDGAVKGAKSKIATLANDAKTNGRSKGVEADAEGDSANTDDGTSSNDNATEGTGNPTENSGSDQPSSDATDDEAADNGGQDASGDADESDNEAAEENTQDQSDESDEAAAQASHDIQDVEALKKALNNEGGTQTYGKVETDDAGTITQIECYDPIGLYIVSNAKPELYQNARITFNNTGAGVDLVGEKGGYTFQGFGDEGCPFEGSIDFANYMPVIDSALYGGLSLTDQNKNVSVTWKGTGSSPIIARKIVGNGQELNASVTVDDPVDGGSTAGITGALVGNVTGDLSVAAVYSFSGKRMGVGINATGANENAGLIANTLESGKLTIKSVSDLENDGAEAAISASNGCAGGLVGYAESNTTVAIAKGIDVSMLTVAGSDSAGGLIGKADKLTLEVADDAAVKPARKVGDANTTNAGGLIGSVAFADAYTVKPGMFDFRDQTGDQTGDQTIELGAKKRAGGLFGRLDVTNGDVTVKGGEYKSELTAGHDNSGDGNKRGSYGGIAGNVCSSTTDEAIRALLIQSNGNDKTKTTINRASNLCYTGGVVGYIGDNGGTAASKVAVVLDGAQVTLEGDKFAYNSNGKYGGAVGVVDTNNVLDVRDFKLIGSVIGKKGKGGTAGIAGSAWRGIIKFSGTTDLSEATFDNQNTVAQLVFENYNALIFAAGSGSDANTDSDAATGWKFVRTSSGKDRDVKIDDIHDYGEVIRLGNGLRSDLIKLDKDTHDLSLDNGSKLPSSADGYVLNNVNDFAKLAITWQTFGYFSMVDGVEAGKVADSMKKSITVTKEIDLAGTGLTGLTKDRVPGDTYNYRNVEGTEWESAHVFSGRLKGSRKIDLAVGEPYGMRDGNVLDSSDTSEGNGKIYRHGRLGLFGAVSDATIEGVTIGGTMRFDDKNNVDAGALAATRASGQLTISGVHFETAITYDNTNSDTNTLFNVGGVLGSVSGDGKIIFQNNAQISGSITSRVQDKSNSRVGGAIGYIAGDSTISIDVNGLTIGSNITVNDYANGKQALVGGFIGYIWQGAAPTEKAAGVTKSIQITGLHYKDFTLTTDAKSSNQKHAGGLLGYSWGNTLVTFGGDANSQDNYALTTENAQVNATNATEFGGLVYATSGHWTVGKHAIDLSGAKFSAASANKFGMLVCHGGTNLTASTVGSSKDTLSGLYLENVAYWDVAYRVSDAADAITINTKDPCFDEWVADTTKEGSTTNDNDCNGVISLHTQANQLDMSGDSGKDNSYINRTSYGQQHKTNQYARYYYNLDRCWKDGASQVNSYTLTSAEGLMVWNLIWYAPNGLRQYMFPGVKYDLYTGVTIKGTDQSSSTIDLKGYSYYPTNINCGVTIQNVTIAFGYSKIKSEQANNKRNDQTSQHANMHAALIRTYTGRSNRTLTIQDVCLTGSTGSMINDTKTSGETSHSGALICRYANGVKDDSGNVSATTISINGLKLDGLKVDGADAADKPYAPLLINEMPQYITLDVKNLSIKSRSYDDAAGNKTIAASSLFGKLGGTGSTNTLVNASLSDNIELPTRCDQPGQTIFSHASFFESFAYGTNQSGSASYIFNTHDKVTYGKEIDSNGEYPNKQLWYYDAAGYGQASGPGLVSDGEITAVYDKHDQFSSKYLPYVAKGREGSSYHEMKVNQRAADLVLGCGTYTDPYSVRTDQEVVAFSKYINDQNSVDDGWQVTITSNQNEKCDRRGSGSAQYEATYKVSVSNDRKWTKVSGAASAKDELTNDVMHRYMQSAYYSIEPSSDDNTIELSTKTYEGIGSQTNPFRGVIVGDLAQNGTATIKISASDKTTSGLIHYSYGSVIRKLNIQYEGTNTLQYNGKDTSVGVPRTFFGGVIGCIMGGDNIIDGVNVTGADDFLQTTGDKKYLIPRGGYVGAICGGGVIFRDMGSSTNWRADTKDSGSLYDNPYVGRVIDGYAFAEDCSIENGNQNYQVNELTKKGTACVETTDIYEKYGFKDDNNKGAAQVSVNNSQGLLVLSAIIQSGAAAGATHTNYVPGAGVFRGSRAYEGQVLTEDELNSRTYKFGNEKYGKVRNANYSSVGSASVDSKEWDNAQADDQKAPGCQEWEGPLNVTEADYNNDKINSPYLVKQYANWATGYVCATSMQGIQLNFNNQSYDMTNYGLGYRGLSGNYYSNACVTENSVNYYQYITPSVACINGNGAQITVVKNLQEYAQDDFKVSGVGGLFNNAAFTSNHKVMESIDANDGATAKDLTFKDCNLSIAYINEEGTATIKQDSDTLNIGVGCLAGVTSDVVILGTLDDSLQNSGTFKGIKIDGCTVTGGASAGGLIGNVGYVQMRGAAGAANSSMVENGDKVSSVKLVDCQYTSNSKNNTNITAEANAGGFIGKQQNAQKAWVAFSADATSPTNVFGSNSTVRATLGWGISSTNHENCTVGGLIGLTNVKVEIGKNSTKDNRVTLADVTVTTDKLNGFTYNRGLGGLVGRAEGTVEAQHVTVERTANSASYLGSKNANNDNYKYAGGVVGYANGNVTADDCVVKNINFDVCQGAGGIVAAVAGSVAVTADNVLIDSITTNGAYSGGILGIADGTSGRVAVTNAVVKTSVFAKRKVGSQTCSGGILGDAKGTIRMSNVLVNGNTFGEPSYEGLVFGNALSGTRVYAAGLDVELTPDQKNGSAGNVPQLIHGNNADTIKAVNQKSFIAFGDYQSTHDTEHGAKHAQGSDLYDDEDSEGGVASSSPYVTTSPVADDPQVKASSGAAAKKLFGDGVAIDTAETIKNEAGKSVAGQYTYNNIGGRNDSGDYQTSNGYDPGSKSKFNEQNAKSAQAPTNFNVLVISGNDTTTVANYLNLVTNGGFSDAVRLNGSTAHVTATTQMFVLNENGQFVREDSQKASLSVVNSGKSDMSFRASASWDNGKSRFTLLTVTFNDGANHTYKVQVPIVVKRMLEIDFSATYDYGTKFNATNFGNLTSHVLTGMGDTMTGYLTWTYNEAMGKETRYGLDTLLDSGGALTPVNKSIVFDGADGKGTLPNGTQLTLVDAQDNDKQYTYTVTADDTSGNQTTVPLTKFANSAGGHYKERWLSELMGVTATPDSKGGWFQLAANADTSEAVAKVGGYYYRLAKDGDDSSKLYKLSLLDEHGKSKERTVPENFFLVVRVPTNASKAVNGFTSTKVTADVNCNQPNVVRRRDKSETDLHSGNESTYSIASSYTQVLTDNKKSKPDADDVVKMQMEGQDTTYRNVRLDVTDQITLGDNLYNPDDPLYFQLDSSLANFGDNGSLGSVGYPKGAQIVLSLYVKIGDTYYAPSLTQSAQGGYTTTWTSASAEEAKIRKNFVANGGDLSVTLSDSNGTLYDLRDIRELAKSSKQFSIEMTASVEMTETQCQAAIMASQNGGSYTKPTYRSYLSVRSDALSSSSDTADNEGGVRYYRPDWGTSTIALVATKKTQLSINVNDLNSADGTIALVGTYDLSKLKDADTKINKAGTVTYTLSLQQKQDDGKYADVSSIGKYLNVAEYDHSDSVTESSDGKSIVFTDRKRADGTFATLDGDSLAFKHRFVVKVNTDVENNKQFYANYRLVLTAHLEGSGVSDVPVNVDGLTDYFNSDFVTYTITKVETRGIDRHNANHSAN